MQCESSLGTKSSPSSLVYTSRNQLLAPKDRKYTNIPCLRIILARRSSGRRCDLVKTRSKGAMALVVAQLSLRALKKLLIPVPTEPGVPAAPAATKKGLLALIIKLSLPHLLLLSRNSNRNKSSRSRSIIGNSNTSNHSINNSLLPRPRLLAIHMLVRADFFMSVLANRK